MKAIETKYKGYRFRSRLEAKWAVFFETLGIKWEYEKEGFEFDKGLKYLPDFWLPSFDMWVEVKPVPLSFREYKKCIRLSRESGKNVLLLVGIPEAKPYRYISFLEKPEDDFSLSSGNFPGISRSVWDDVILTRENHGGAYWSTGYGFKYPENYDWGYDDLKNAVNAARSSRFEFGESG